MDEKLTIVTVITFVITATGGYIIHTTDTNEKTAQNIGFTLFGIGLGCGLIILAFYFGLMNPK